MPKPENPGTVELEGTIEESKNFWKVTIVRNVRVCSQCGLEREHTVSGIIHIPKERSSGLPDEILIKVVKAGKEV
jgi:hypothetical protein